MIDKKIGLNELFDTVIDPETGQPRLAGPFETQEQLDKKHKKKGEDMPEHNIKAKESCHNRK